MGRRRARAEDRTPEQRAAAAAERMRRRGIEPPPDLARSAVPPDPGPQAAEPQPVPEPLPAEPDPVAPEPAPEPLPVEPEPVAPEPPAVEPEPVAPEPQPAPEPLPTAAEPARSWLDEDEDEEDRPEPAQGASAQAATAVQRRPARAAPPLPAGGVVANRRRAAPPRPASGGAGGGGGRRSGRPAPSAPRRPLPPAGPRTSKARRRTLALLVLLIVGALAYAAFETFQPFHDEPTGTVAVTVPDGAGAGRIGDLLESRGVIDSGTFFSINATVTGRRGSLRSGDYVLQRGMTNGAALDALTRGPTAKVVKTFKVTLPEGPSARELAPVARKAGVDGDYVAAARSRSALRSARRLGLPRRARSAEGFLFPATYELITGADAGDLVERQLAAYRDQTDSVSYRSARRRNLTRYDVLIIASMIERETQLDRERPLVAAVIYNRLKDGMPLGIDATIRYAERNWDSPLKQSELDRPGPYNTRLNRGLPPTPIGNPGLASIRAAARPARVSYRYYVVKPGTRGHAFSSTEAGFERDRARYNAAREAAGGNSPTP